MKAADDMRRVDDSLMQLGVHKAEDMWRIRWERSEACVAEAAEEAHRADETLIQYADQIAADLASWQLRLQKSEEAWELRWSACKEERGRRAWTLCNALASGGLGARIQRGFHSLALVFRTWCAAIDLVSKGRAQQLLHVAWLTRFTACHSSEAVAICISMWRGYVSTAADARSFWSLHAATASWLQSEQEALRRQWDFVRRASEELRAEGAQVQHRALCDAAGEAVAVSANIAAAREEAAELRAALCAQVPAARAFPWGYTAEQ